MQGYTYSIFSIVAIVIHLIINFDLLTGRKEVSVRGARYRGFLLGILAYYVTDAAWGILAGLGWTKALYVATVFFFLGLVVFALMWCRFVVVYLDFGKWPARLLTGSGYALLITNIALLAANICNHCVFYFDEQGKYLLGSQRDLLFFLLIAFNVLISAAAFVKALRSQDSVRSRNMMVVVHCITMTLSITLQVIWPLTPFTALGCLIGNCFLHVFVVKDEQSAKHMAKLEKALERARMAEKARSMFFSIVSHDIRTPLNAILGYAELLQSANSTQAEREEALHSIRASGTTLLQLVNDVLDLAKMDAGRVTIHLEPVCLSRLTDEVFASFRLAASEKSLKLVNRTDEVPVVMLDGHRFRQILFNLVGNAVKFTSHGAVAVRASCNGPDLTVSVSDTGCGIPADMLTHILDPFVQVQDPSHAADRAVGTGLGLSICKSLVETMGGKLIIESDLGKGSTFTVFIPDVSVCGEEAPPVKQAAVLGKCPQRVLVVDDSPVNRKVLAAFLKKAGVPEIELADNGVSALVELDSAANADHPYDFVLSDLWMPNMNGYEFIEKLRADPRFGQLPVFAVTADTEFRNDPRNRLFTGVFLKPVTYEKLVNVFSAQS